MSEHNEPGYPGISGATMPPGVRRIAPRPRPDQPDKRAIMWRRVRRTLYVLIALGFLGPILAFVITYQYVKVPDPNQLLAELNQPLTMYYADGSTLYTSSLTAESHQLATWDQIPQSMKNAQMAAEDETFMTNSGFDMKAIIRTVWNRLTGGTGGGSTIGQEYVKNATGNNAPTLQRKFLEMVESYKMTNTFSKQDILTAYLNTVYFGRGAYGVKAAAHMYFNEDVSKLTDEQAALLAGLVQLPRYANSSSYQHQRYSYVMSRMLANHWITPAEYGTAKFPTPIPTGADAPALSPTRRYIANAVFAELAAKGLSESTLVNNGARIYTTIQPQAQLDAENSVTQVTAADGQYPDEAAALVSVDPRTGGILAYYGGDGSTSYDLAQTPQQPGSSFKPYVLAAGLRAQPQNIGLDTLYDGSDDQTIDGQVVHNADGEGAPQITVKDAMTKSVNTVFYRMGAQVGPQTVRQAAWDAGIPKRITPSLGPAFDSLQESDPKTGQGSGVTQLGIAIGQYPVRPIDQAQGYATFANNGMYLPVHFVAKVIGDHDNQLFDFATPATQAFSPDPNTNAQIAATVTASMNEVAASSQDPLAGNRPNAAKTGTAQYLDTGHNSEAWMVGYTPQVVTAVWFGNKRQPAPIYGNYKGGHGYNVYGREEPGYIWQAYMNAYLTGQPVTPFPNVDTISGGNNYSGTPTATQPPATQAPTTTQQPAPTTAPVAPTPPTISLFPTPPCVLDCGPPTTSRHHRP
ncbi:MAG TPA: transglycosylase domain-containing protein [Pseudonocardiaceae bacterium]|nr:transglycosylase domain-containing protein [Pseudonocardiaceae bacterium]